MELWYGTTADAEGSRCCCNEHVAKGRATTRLASEDFRNGNTSTHEIRDPETHEPQVQRVSMRLENPRSRGLKQLPPGQTFSEAIRRICSGHPMTVTSC